MAVTDTGLDVQQINHLWQRDGIPKKGGSFVNTTETHKKQITVTCCRNDWKVQLLLTGGLQFL